MKNENLYTIHKCPICGREARRAGCKPPLDMYEFNERRFPDEFRTVCHRCIRGLYIDLLEQLDALTKPNESHIDAGKLIGKHLESLVDLIESKKTLAFQQTNWAAHAFLKERMTQLQSYYSSCPARLVIERGKQDLQD